jgi:hypothetical protein
MNDLLAGFAASPAEQADLGALRAAPVPELLALIPELAAARQRAHLEALAHRSLPRAVRKAAGKAAYQLKSAGVADEWRPAAPARALEVVEDLGLVGGCVGPGLVGLASVVVGQVGMGYGFGLTTDMGAAGCEVDVVGALSRSQLRRELRNRRDPGERVVLCDVHLAARFVDWVAVELAERGPATPEGWSKVLEWRQEARAHGADPAQAAARSRVEVATPPRAVVEAVLSNDELGVFSPPPGVVDTLGTGLDAAVKSPIEVTQVAFRQRLMDSADRTLDAWLAEPADRARVLRWLELDADVAWAAGLPDQAAAILWTADRLSDPAVEARSLDLLKRSMARLVDHDGCWAARLADREGDQGSAGPSSSDSSKQKLL